MSSRDAILGRIRTALVEHPEPDRPLPLVAEVWPRLNPPVEQMVERFTKELELLRGEVIRCASLDAARKKLAEMAAAEKWTRLGAMDRPACRELAAGLPPELPVWGADDWTPPSMAEFSAGLIAPECLLADTGSCLIVSGTAQDRLLCYLPPICVVIARTEQLVEHLPAAWPALAQRAAEPATRGEFVIITGPSRTSDIEKILILGVHGPKRLIVLLVG
jgi:L-lactate dehydrogenase complex protein LldG